MLLYDNQEVSESLYKSEIIGKNQTYNFYSPSTAYNIKSLKGQNAIIIESVLNLENGKKTENFDSINYYDSFNGKDFDDSGLFNVYLKSFNSKDNALNALEDIKLKHKI